MRFISFMYGGVRSFGVLDTADVVHDMAAVVGSGDFVDAVARWDDVREAVAAGVAGPGVPLADVELLAPVPRPRRNIFCVGKNYLEHAREFGSSGYDHSAGAGTDHVPGKPVVFTKAPSTVVGPGADVEAHPTVTKELDYEAELAVIIGRGGRDIPASRALEHVWGYTAVNDVTARDRQRDHKQWFLGKSLDTHCPMGPWALTADELDLATTRVQCRVNGELRQDASTADLIFDVPTIIETISAGLTLEPGDVIATGTPAGVGIGFDPPRFLTSGDVVEVAITGLGVLRNRIH
jgi:2-keto-4-pentenoate hydratase/2-oxohepta-3-ene-1,7-dioic acid hydratase in catechol pathway